MEAIEPRCYNRAIFRKLAAVALKKFAYLSPMHASPEAATITTRITRCYESAIVVVEDCPSCPGDESSSSLSMFHNISEHLRRLAKPLLSERCVAARSGCLDRWAQWICLCTGQCSYAYVDPLPFCEKLKYNNRFVMVNVCSFDSIEHLLCCFSMTGSWIAIDIFYGYLSLLFRSILSRNKLWISSSLRISQFAFYKMHILFQMLRNMWWFITNAFLHTYVCLQIYIILRIYLNIIFIIKIEW